MKALSACIVFANLLFPLLGQDIYDHDPDTQTIGGLIFADPDEAINYESVLENIAIPSSPFDLNSVTEEELTLTHILTDEQIDNLLSWRRMNGPILDIHELQAIPGFQHETIRALLPFVKVSDPAQRLDASLFRRAVAAGKSYILTRYQQTLEKKKGARSLPGSDKFAGSPGAFLLRMRSTIPGDLSIGFTGEKDDGERFRFDARKRQWGFDFTSFHIQVKNKGKLQNLILGDFQSQFAQGLLFGGAFAIGKSSEQISSLRKVSVGFNPYTSIHESAYQRGAALSIKIHRHVNVSAFYSTVRRDAAVTESDSSVVRSIYNTGLHRTEREIASMKKLNEQNAGMIVRINTNNFDGGVMANIIRYDAALRRKETPYNQFAFSGHSNINAGFFVNYRLENLSFFSEAGKTVGGGTAVIAGLLLNVHKNLEIGTLYRSYGVDFHTFYSNAISENTFAQNERGFYWTWKYRWDRHWSINGYVDIFQFPWLGFRRYRPSSGYETLLRGSYRPSKETRIVFQVRQESKSRNVQRETKVYGVAESLRQNALLAVEYVAGRGISLNTRIQFNARHFDETYTEGWAFVQDITFRVGRFRFSARHGLFDTDDYDNRHYIYERDAWSSYSMPAYAGVGVRNYALFEYKIGKSLTLWARYACTRMLENEEIGSGVDTIEGNTRNDVKFQARLTF